MLQQQIVVVAVAVIAVAVAAAIVVVAVASVAVAVVVRHLLVNQSFSLSHALLAYARAHTHH